MTPPMIKQVNAIAEKEKMPDDLKIKNRINNVFDTSLTVGVDYNKKFDDEINDQEIYDRINNQYYSSDGKNSSNNDSQLTDDMYEIDENELGGILEEQSVISKKENSE